MTDITLLDRDDIDQVANLISTSFSDDVGIRFAFRTPGSRRRWSQKVVTALARLATSYGKVTGIRAGGSSELAAVACWFWHDRPFPPPWHRRLLPCLNLTPMVLEYLACRRYERLGRMYLSLMPKKTKLIYLAGLAVHADCRSQGLGRRLVEWGQQHASDADCAIFLQCWEELLPYYERFGFCADSKTKLRGIDDTCYGLLWWP